MADAPPSTTRQRVTTIVQDAVRRALTELAKDAVREVNEATAAEDRAAERTRSGLLLVGVGVALGRLLSGDGLDADELAREAGRVEERLADADERDGVVSVDPPDEDADGSAGGRLKPLLAVLAVAGLAAAGYVALRRGDAPEDDIGRRGPSDSSGVDTSLETGVDAGTGVNEGAETDTNVGDVETDAEIGGAQADTEVGDVQGTAPGGVNENEAATEPSDDGDDGALRDDEPGA